MKADKATKELLKRSLAMLQDWIFAYDGCTPPDATQFQYCVVCGVPDYKAHKEDCAGAKLIADITKELLK